MDKLKPSGKSFDISKWEVWEAYRRVKANRGAPGVDGVTLEEFEKDLKNNLYKIWNRMSSGSYFPPPVLAVEIPKTAWRWDENPWCANDLGQSGPNGGSAQAGGEGRPTPHVVALPRRSAALEPIFHPDSYGYRPHPLAHRSLLPVMRWRAYSAGSDRTPSSGYCGFLDGTSVGVTGRPVR